MKGGLSMYLLRNAYAEQINMANGSQYKPSIDLRICWLNPLLYRCKKRLYPEKVL